MAPKTVLAEFDLSSPECDLGAYFLDDPYLAGSSNVIYRLADKTTFHRNEVLNHKIGKDGVLRRGDQLEGVLLAQAFESVPKRYKPGSRMPVVLSIVDEFGESTEWSINLMVQEPYFKAPSKQVRRSIFEPEPAAPGPVAPRPPSNADGLTGPAPAEEFWEEEDFEAARRPGCHGRTSA